MELNALLFLVGRILYGGYFVMSGINHFQHADMMAGYAGSKGVKSPKLAVYFSGLLLLVGGLGILFGVWINFAVLCLVLFLVPVTFMMHNYWKDTDTNMKMSNRINFMKNMALLGAALMFLAIATPWAMSL